MTTTTTTPDGPTPPMARRRRGDSPARRSPRHRPPAALRAMIGLAGLGALLGTGLLLLSDRAPGLLAAMFGERAKRLWERIDGDGRTDVVTGGVRPEPDFVVHIAIWAVVACLVGLAVWSWFGLVASAAAVFGVSVVTEVAQGIWSTTREVEASDLTANAIGVSAGVVAAAVVYLAWSGVAVLVTRRA